MLYLVEFFQFRISNLNCETVFIWEKLEAKGQKDKKIPCSKQSFKRQETTGETKAAQNATQEKGKEETKPE